MIEARATRCQARRFAIENDVPMFVPFVTVPTPDVPGGVSWRYRCKALTTAGRCSIYENRPDLCKRYAVGQDDLCVHSHGTEAGDASAFDHPHYLAAPLREDDEAPWPAGERKVE